MSPYRSIPPSKEVHVVEMKGSLISRIKAWFWHLMFRLTNNKEHQLRMAESLLKGLPSEAFCCVDCGQDECVCPEVETMMNAETFEQCCEKLEAIERQLAERLNINGDIRQELIELDRRGLLVEDELVREWHEVFSRYCNGWDWSA